MVRRANVSFYIPHVRAFQDISQAMRVGFLRRRIYGQTIRNIASDIFVHEEPIPILRPRHGDKIANDRNGSGAPIDCGVACSDLL